MHLYKFGYGSYEDSMFTEIFHIKQFSEQEFSDITTNAIIRVLQGVIDKKYDPYIHEDGLSYEDIHDFVLEELKLDGFEEIKYQAEWSCFGWPSLVDKSSWGSQRGPELNKLFWKIPEDIRYEILKLGREDYREDKKRFDIRYREVLTKTFL
jgi:nicotinamidase-related amidase